MFDYGVEEVQLELESVDKMEGTRAGQEHGNGIARHFFHFRAAQTLVPPFNGMGAEKSGKDIDKRVERDCQKATPEEARK